jgi:signal transduction histidine kinase
MLQIKALSHNTLQTLDNTLDWVKTQINSGYVAMQSNVALYSATEEVIDFLHNMASAKKINIKNLIPETTLAYVDLNHYKIIVRNLIANAIKFSHENSEILVSASTNPNGVILSIKDFGVGMSEESINKLFNPNTHFSTKGTNDEKGTGLGLMLCKELLDKNKAQIEIKSTLGKGTEFMVIFALPKNLTEQS